MNIHKEQIRRLANIFDNAGQVSLGSLVINSIIEKSNYYSINVTIVGTLLTLMCWYFSLKFEKMCL